MGQQHPGPWHLRLTLEPLEQGRSPDSFSGLLLASKEHVMVGVLLDEVRGPVLGAPRTW